MAPKSRWKHACLCAVFGGVRRRSLYVGLVVGTVLSVINQGEAIIGIAAMNWLKLALTYCVPNAVCAYGAVSHEMQRRACEAR